MSKLIPFFMLVIGVVSSHLFADNINAQSTSDSSNRIALKGDIRLARVDWVYSVYGLKNVGAKRVPVSIIEYNEADQIAVFVDFGSDGSQMRKAFSYDPSLTTVTFLDAKGVESVSARLKFIPNSNIPIETDLCPEYDVRKETILNSSDSLSIETCSDGSARASTLHEKDAENRVIRELRTDIKKRSWESRVSYSTNGEVSLLLHIVNNGVEPPYWQSNEYVDHRFDDKGNVTSYVGTLLTSRTGKNIYHQWKAEIRYEYRNQSP